MGDTSKNLPRNLEYWLYEKKMSQAELAKRIGVSAQTISNYVSGRNLPRMSRLDDICKTLGVTRSDLLGSPVSPLSYDNAEPRVLPPITSIPIYGRIAAGLPIEANQEIDGSIQVPRDRLHGGEFFGLRASGDSMYPRIEDGDALLFEKTAEYKSGDICAVYVNGYDATVKQVIKRDDQVVLQPVNPSYKAASYPQDEVEVVGMIKMIQRNF